MSKIFRLYKEGASTYEDWNNSPAFPYNSASRDSIEDPDGASAKHEITSIPSPFARIDLIKTAFKEVCKSNNLDGKTIFHKMVSDTLDVAEIFFNIDRFEGKIEIIKWDPSVMLTELDNSGIPGHHYLADALRKYLASDAKTYNFDKLNNIYLLNYIQGPNELNIIGATSPATLFFSGANNLDYINDIFFGEDKPFDNQYQPLYKRDFEFVTYLFTLRSSIPNFAGLFPEVNDYLTKTYQAIKDNSKKEELRNITPTALDLLSTISVVDQQQNDTVEVLGNPLYKKSTHIVTSSCDFTIETTKETTIKPLVLPVESGNKYSALQYTTDKWGTSNAAPYFDEETDLTKRKLPFDGSINPYLTISDFLEDTIIRVPHTLNSENYFNGNLKLDKKELAYILPLKPLLFEYFTPDEIRGEMKDGKPMFEMNTLSGGSIIVTLRVPISGANRINYIEYTRKYYNNRAADIQKNEGGMTEFKFTGFIMPLIKFENENDAIYNVSCIQAYTGKIEFQFYQNNKKIQIKNQSCRNNSNIIPNKADNYLIEESNFDFIRICDNHGYCGIVLPIFKPQRNIEQFEFAVDLGTSNTHIEFRKAGANQPEAFSFDSKDRQACEMFIAIKNEYGEFLDLLEETYILEKDFIPDEIGPSDFSFPTRTVLSYAKTVDWNTNIDPFTLANLPFTYDKRTEFPYNNYESNIKWGNSNDLRLMELYVRCLMLIIRNKVLLNNGDLQRTKITWFYPISMPPKRLNKLKQTWDDAYEKYFGNGSTDSMTESAAPIQYFFKKYATATDLVNVDIGGGTTDIAFAKDKRINYVTSFRFASNSLFENPFADFDENNGIIDWHKSEILKLLEEKGLSDLISVFNSTNNARPANMASFLFGLKNNTFVKAKNIRNTAIDFNYILQEDENFKIVFIIFYTAIIYHIAQIVKSLGLNLPRHISFSGNGSKVIRIITPDSTLLAEYTKLIFEKVLGRKYDKELDLLGLEKDSNPKETTCKGGIIGTESEEDINQTIVFKSDCSGLVTPTDTYESITEDYKRKTISAVEKFFNFTLNEMNSVFNFKNNFGVNTNSIRIAQECAKKDLNTFLNKGITQRLEETQSIEMIEETFFFYPIKGVINAISTELGQNKTNNPEK